MHSGTFRNGWNYVRVKLQGVQRFGSEVGKYKVSSEVKEAKSGFALVKQTGKYSSEKEETNVYSTSFPGSLFYPSVGRVGENPGNEVDVYHGFDVIFDPPICLEQGKTYEIASLIKGPPSWWVRDGIESGEVQGIQFSFSNSGAFGIGTSGKEGQFPAIIFSIM